MQNLTTLEVSTSDSIGRILLARPEKRNAISPTMAEELTRVFEALGEDPDVRAVVMRGAGGHFCSGGDLAPENPAAGEDAEPPRPSSPAAATLDIMNRVYGRMIGTLHRFPKPVVACVEGTAAGAGANLALACDLVYAARDARICEIFVKRGLGLDCGGSWLLPRLVGLQRAKEIAFFGDWLSAEEACAYGLVTAVHDPDRLVNAVEERLKTLASRPPIALAEIKRSLHRAMALSMEEALEMEAIVQGACSSTQDCAEGMGAFLEKREPEFKGC